MSPNFHFYKIYMLEKIFANHISGKELVAQIHKEPWKPNNKNIIQSENGQQTFYWRGYTDGKS